MGPDEQIGNQAAMPGMGRKRPVKLNVWQHRPTSTLVNIDWQSNQLSPAPAVKLRLECPAVLDAILKDERRLQVYLGRHRNPHASSQ